MKKLFKRKTLITIAGVAISSYALFKGRMSDSVWVYAQAVFIAGHHAEDLIKAWKGTPDATVIDMPGGEKRDWQGA